jgi:TonB family protein
MRFASGYQALAVVSKRGMTPLLITIAMLIAHQSTAVPLPAQSQPPPAPTIRVWSAVTPAVVKTRVEPAWPVPALNDTRGTIVLDVWIDEGGNVAFVQIVRSIPLDDTAGINAVRQWKFTPALRSGQPIAVVQEVRLQKF